jgi:hypothetical protein
MPIKCKLVNKGPADKVYPGDMFYIQYTNKKEPHLIVILPNGGEFDLTHAADTSKPVFWEVTGEAPNITVSPSIDRPDGWLGLGWHGYLKDGVLSDDLEGRSYG